MKKIFFLHHCDQIGGAGLSGLNVLNSIDKTRYQIKVFCPKTTGMYDIFSKNGFDVESLPEVPLFPYYSGSSLKYFFGKFFFIIKKIKKFSVFFDALIKKEKPDLVIFNSMTLFYLGMITKKSNVHSILFFRETFMFNGNGFVNLFIKHIISKNIEYVSFISKYDYLKCKNIKSKKEIIPNALNFPSQNSIDEKDLPFSYNFDSNKRNLIFLGGNDSIKGLDICLKAFSKLSNEYVLHIVGCEDYFIKRANANSRFDKKCYKLIDYIDNNRLFLYARTDKAYFLLLQSNALIQPIIVPHQSRPLFEAGFARKPVFITNFKQIKAEFDKQCCFYFKNKKYKQLAKMIEKSFCDVETIEKVVENNYENSITNHSFENYVKKISTLIDNATN